MWTEVFLLPTILQVIRDSFCVRREIETRKLHYKSNYCCDTDFALHFSTPLWNLFKKGELQKESHHCVAWMFYFFFFFQYTIKAFFFMYNLALMWLIRWRWSTAKREMFLCCCCWKVKRLCDCLWLCPCHLDCFCQAFQKRQRKTHRGRQAGK